MVNPLNPGLYSIVESVIGQEQTQNLLVPDSIQLAQIEQQITQIILTSPEPETLLESITRALGEFFQVDLCLIVAAADSSFKPALWSADGYPKLSQEHPVQLLEHPVLSDNFTGADPLAITDIHLCASEKARGEPWGRLPTRAVVRIYTRFQSFVNGVIVLGRLQPYEWTTREKELLKMISDKVAIAISQAQMTLQLQAATRHQTLLNQLIGAIKSALDLNEILEIAIASTAQALMVDRGLLLLLKYSDPLFKTQHSKHLPKTEVTVACEWSSPSLEHGTPNTESSTSLLNQSFWLSESALCQRAFKSAPEPIAIVNQQDAPGLDVWTAAANCSILEQEMMPAVLIVPLLGAYSNTSPTAATILGFLVLQHHQPRSWQTNELELVKWVSVQVSAAIIQNQTLRQVQSLVEDRTAQLQGSLEIQAKLYEKTRQQMNQLQQLNLLKDEFLSSMSHELRTPLTTMSLAIRMLRQPQLPSERRDKYLEILEQECNKEIDLINDLLSLQRLESNQSQLQPQKVDLMLLIKELAQSFEEKWANKRLTFTVESPVRSLRLNTDPDSLNRILIELLTNAGKYSDADTTITLQVTHKVQHSVNQVVLNLSNTGSGILLTDLTHIFEKFHRGQGVTQKAVQGTGLGLALVKCLVQHLNGTIDVTSSPLENSHRHITSFTLTLPQLQRCAES